MHNSEEQQPLEEFFKAKNIRFKNEMLDDSATLLAASLDPEDLATSEDEPGGPRGSADDEEESVDEDFQDDSDSDVAEEYDSAHESEGSGSGSGGSGAPSDAEMDGADQEADGISEDEEERRPKKRVKS